MTPLVVYSMLLPGTEADDGSAVLHMITATYYGLGEIFGFKRGLCIIALL